jgi:hypothetical protein
VFRAGGSGGLVGEGFGAIEVNGSVFEGVEERDVGLNGEEVVGDVVAGGEWGGFCGWIGHVCSLLEVRELPLHRRQTNRWQLCAG